MHVTKCMCEHNMISDTHKHVGPLFHHMTVINRTLLHMPLSAQAKQFMGAHIIHMYFEKQRLVITVRNNCGKVGHKTFVLLLLLNYS